MLLNNTNKEFIYNTINNFKNEYSNYWDCFNASDKKSFLVFIKNNYDRIRLFCEENDLDISYDWFDYAIHHYDMPFSDTNQTKYFALLEFIAKATLCDTIEKTIESKANIVTEKNIDVDVNLINSMVLIDGDNQELWYRGQSNYEWGLLPSFYRNFPYGRKYIPLTIDERYLQKDYFEKGLMPKYMDIFDKTNKIDYDFLAFMQHAVSYSPLIDFTQDSTIAVSFALSNTNSFNDYQNKDSAIFKLYLESPKSYSEYIEKLNKDFYYKDLIFQKEHIIKDVKKANDIVRDFKVFVCKKYSIGAPINGTNIQSFDQIVDYLTPKFLFFDIKNK